MDVILCGGVYEPNAYRGHYFTPAINGNTLLIAKSLEMNCGLHLFMNKELHPLLRAMCEGANHLTRDV